MKNVLTSIVLLIVAVPAVAAPTVKLLPAYSGSYAGNGPHVATVLTEGIGSYGVGSSFQTFCIEVDETFYFGCPYYVSISTAAVDGGVGGGSPDPLGVKTAWLYNQFLDNAFTGDLIVDSLDDGKALQKAIWMFEDEAIMDASNKYVSYADQYCDWTDIRNIRVMNLWQFPDLTGMRQDHLIRIPSAVPAPGAILLCSAGTILTGYLRRRRVI